ncbi:MAG: Gfo/Idh/MocA family oxidoreductase [Anaerolineales bacterium]|nr:Gfo/Idh/MocA family oxidoreductase [Anaerolineales bacterium]
MDKLGVGLIGLGAISPHHITGLEQVQDRARIVAVCDVDGDKAKKVAQELGAEAYTDHEKLLANDKIDIVDLILPHNLHFPIAMQSMEAGKHVLVEKPMTVKSSQALQLVEKSKELNLKFTVAENTRFVDAYVQGQEVIKNELGTPRLIKTFISGSEVYRLVDASLWKGRKDGSCGGVIIDSGAHSFYLLKWLFGEILDVQTFMEKLIPESQVEDNTVVAGHLKCGAIFMMEVCFTAELPWNEQLEFYGSEGAYIVNQLLNPPVRIYKGKKDLEGSTLPDVPFKPIRWKYDSIGAGAADFVNAVWEDRPTLVDPMDGYYAVKVIEKAYESGSLGQPVKI